MGAVLEELPNMVFSEEVEVCKYGGEDNEGPRE